MIRIAIFMIRFTPKTIRSGIFLIRLSLRVIGFTPYVIRMSKRPVSVVKFYIRTKDFLFRKGKGMFKNIIYVEWKEFYDFG